MQQPNPAIEIVSVHVPKTAGYAFADALLQVYDIKEVFYDYPYEFEVNLKRIEPQIKVIHGHFLAAKYRNYFPKAKTIIWLRDPIKRLISHYFFWKNTTPEENNNLHHLLVENKLSIVEFAEMPEMQNHITSFFVKGMKLTDFYFVGIQEFFIEDLTDLKTMLGWSYIKKNPKIINQNPEPRYKEAFNNLLSQKEIIKKLKDLNIEDIEYYRAALNYRVKHRMELKAKQIQQIQSELAISESTLIRNQENLIRNQENLIRNQERLHRSQTKTQHIQVSLNTLNREFSS